jgi:endonuclease YncB( thermonuclease family)
MLFWYGCVLNPSKRDPLGIVDGDTVNAIVDLGDYCYRHMALRLYGINAPEMKTQAGKDAKLWAIDWYQTNCPDGFFIIKSNDTDPEDKYGRLLATVYAPSGQCYNTDIVAAGHAVPYLP